MEVGEASRARAAVPRAVVDGAAVTDSHVRRWILQVQ